MELYEASNQWLNRPDDERFESLQALHDATRQYAVNAVQSKAALKDLRVEPTAGQLQLVGKTERSAVLTHYSFGQLSRLVGAPAGYLRELPPGLAAQCLNTGLEKSERDDKLNLLFHRNGQLVTRAITTDSYDRVWNYQVAAAMMRNLTDSGWVVPPARPARSGQKGTRIATEADIIPQQKDFGLSVKVGDAIAPAGLYASDHDMFAFLVNFVDPIWDGTKHLMKGFFIQNSEVGDCALKGKFFIADNVCGNHIVWGVQDFVDIVVRHVKSERLTHGTTLRRAVQQWNLAVQKMPTAGEFEKVIAAAKGKEIAATKDEVLDALFSFAKKNSLSKLTRTALSAGYDVAARTPRYGSPRSVWGMVNGLTEYSQQGSGYTDERTDLDVQAGQLLQIAF